jgi:predicted ATPase/DNA-binding winged helix-turn-helix (wHTH) protein
MNAKPYLRFDRFRLDCRNEELRDDSRLISLRPKTFAVLKFLVENPGQLVTHAALLKGVWGQVAVGDGLLRGYIREIRHALGDDAAHPRIIETVPRRGFRFLPKVTSDSTPDGDPGPLEFASLPSPELIDRGRDLSTLDRLFASARDGKRQVVFITGEAGIGKTALLNAFLERARGARIACGQCVEQYGTREAYLSIFDALSGLCRGKHADEALAVLTRYAPSWLAQMPGLVSDAQFQALQNRVQGMTQARMLGEFCEAIEVLASEQPFILGLEDLHWTDLSTLELLSMLARREQPARLMVIGTYRPADVIISNHPLKTVVLRLQAHRQCTQLWLDYLTETGIEKYLSHRFPDNQFPAKLKQLIHRNTGGNPLFVTAVVDELLVDRSIEKRDGRWQLHADPERLSSWKSASIRHLIEAQLSRLPIGEQRVLEVAAVVGTEFTIALVAAALEIDAIEVEEHCEALA